MKQNILKKIYYSISIFFLFIISFLLIFVITISFKPLKINLLDYFDRESAIFKESNLSEINKLPRISERTYFTYVTDEELVRQIKSMYSQCQFCDYEFESYINSTGEEKKYSEAAHIRPKSEGGFDDLDNVLCLCANCHSLFDLGTFYIDDHEQDNPVVRKSKKLLGRYEDDYFNNLNLASDHKINESNVIFHRNLTNN